MVVVQTDDRSRVVLPGHSNQLFVARDNSDGSILLEPAQVVTDAQREYDSIPELQALLTKASSAPTVRRKRQRRAV